MKIVARGAAALLALFATAPSRAPALDPLGTFDTDPTVRKQEPGAAATVAPLRFVVQVGYDSGQYETGFFGDEGDAMTGLHFNDGVSFALGVNLAAPSTPVGVQATAGLKYASIEAGGERLVSRAIPFEVLGYVQVEPVRMGLGTSVLLDATLESDGASNIDVPVDPSVGWFLELDWIAPMRDSARGAQTSLGIRYVFQKVTVLGVDYDANCFGAVLNFTL